MPVAQSLPCRLLHPGIVSLRSFIDSLFTNCLLCLYEVCLFFLFVRWTDIFTTTTERALSATSGICAPLSDWLQFVSFTLFLFLAQLWFWPFQPSSEYILHIHITFPFFLPHLDLTLFLLLLVLIVSFFGYGYSHLCASACVPPPPPRRLIHDVAAPAFVHHLFRPHSHIRVLNPFH